MAGKGAKESSGRPVALWSAMRAHVGKRGDNDSAELIPRLIRHAPAIVRFTTVGVDNGCRQQFLAHTRREQRGGSSGLRIRERVGWTILPL